jgi:hypothetical protein
MYVNTEDFSQIMSGAKPSPHTPYSTDGAQDYAEPFPKLSLESRDFAPGVNGTIHSEKWLPRRISRAGVARSGIFSLGTRHGRQKSLSEAINTIKTRKASMSQNAHEIADALRAPVSPKLVVCLSLLAHRSFIALTAKSVHVFCLVYYLHGR